MNKQLVKKLAFFVILFSTSSVFALSGTITKLNGTVMLINQGAVSYATVGSTVQKGTIIKTGMRSYAYLQINNTYSRIDQLSRVQVASLAPQTKTKPARIQLNLRRGKLRAIVTKLNQRGKFTSFKVRTPVSVASVRGTEIEISHGPGLGTIVTFITGHGLFANLLNQSRPIKKGQNSSIGKKGLPTNHITSGNANSNIFNGSQGNTHEEINNIINSDVIVLEHKVENPVEMLNDLLKESKQKVNVNVNITFPSRLQLSTGIILKNGIFNIPFFNM